MDRFAGWYKRWTVQVSLIVAAVVVISVNADTLMLANKLARDSALRAGIVTAADSTTQAMAADFNKVQAARKELLVESEKLNLPLGWIDPQADGKVDPFAVERFPNSFGGWVWKALGLLVSVLAVSLGAPFWFDTLSSFMNLRGAGKVPRTNQSPSIANGKSASAGDGARAR